MNNLQICSAGRAGDGANTLVTFLAQVLKDMGAWVFAWRENVFSNIQTKESAFGLRAADRPIFGPSDFFDILVAFDQSAIVDREAPPPVEKLRSGGMVLYDSSQRLSYPNTGHEIKLEAVKDLIERRMIKVFPIPMADITQRELNKKYIIRNTIASGVIAEIFGIPQTVVDLRFQKSFGSKPETFDLNDRAHKIGREYAISQGWSRIGGSLRFLPKEFDNRQLILGDYAIGAGALAAGCRFYAGYPITPASEILEFMTENLPKFGGAFLQAKKEEEAAHMVLGASLAGARSMTATSGPGFSLMQEAISAFGMTETPGVFVVLQRGGPATGLPTRVGQEDLNETVFGAHGDFARIVLAINNAEQGYYIMGTAFNLAERYQCPVFLLSDQLVGQSTYTTPPLDPSSFTIDRGKLFNQADIEELKKQGKEYKRYDLSYEDGISPRIIPGTVDASMYINSNEHDELGYITEAPALRKAMVEKRVSKRYKLIREDPTLPRPIIHGDKGVQIGFIGYGGVYGPILEAVEILGTKGIRASFLELQTIWPIHHKEVKEFIDGLKRVYFVEYSVTGQLKGLIQREVTGPMPKKFQSIRRYDGRLITPGYIIENVKEVV